MDQNFKRIAIIGIWGAVQGILILWKIGGLVNWSWLIILSPILAPIAVILVLLSVLIVVALLGAVFLPGTVVPGVEAKR